MAHGPYECVLEIGPARIFVGDSVTYFTDLAADDVIVCGSHGGDTAALFGAASGAKALILNDAGGGKEGAGFSGLTAVERYNVAAATVSYLSARIGSGTDTWESGLISHCNRWASAAGVRRGLPRIRESVAEDGTNWADGHDRRAVARRARAETGCDGG